MVKDFAVRTIFAIARIALGIAVVLPFRIKIFVGFTLLWLILVAPVVRSLLLVVSLLLLLTLGLCIVDGSHVGHRHLPGSGQLDSRNVEFRR